MKTRIVIAFLLLFLILAACAPASLNQTAAGQTDTSPLVVDSLTRTSKSSTHLICYPPGSPAIDTMTKHGVTINRVTYAGGAVMMEWVW